MNSVGDAFSAPFQDPGWFGKIVVQGLIFLIPIIGWIALYGWMMLAIENYQSGRRELPPAGFHLSRGWPIFVVYLIYAIVIAIPGVVLGGLGSSGNSGGLSALGNLISFALRLVLLFMAPAIILSTYRGGFGGGLNVSAVWRLATANTTNSIMAGLVLLAASIIGGLGVILCFVGLLFTIPYALAICAGAVVWFEQVSAGPMAATPYSAPPPYTPPAAPAPGSYTPPPPAPPPPGSYTPPPPAPPPPGSYTPPPPPPAPPPPPPPAPPPGSYTPPPPPPAPPPPGPPQPPPG